MTTPTNNGGPAFPHFCEDYVNGERVGGSMFAGMSLRDFFAAKAIPAILETATVDGKPWWEKEGHIDPKIIAEGCYSVADAMLVERAKGAT